MGVQAETGSPREELIESCVSALLIAGLYKTSFTERGGRERRAEERTVSSGHTLQEAVGLITATAPEARATQRQPEATHARLHACIKIARQPHTNECMHACIHTYIHTYMRAWHPNVCVSMHRNTLT